MRRQLQTSGGIRAARSAGDLLQAFPQGGIDRARLRRMPALRGKEVPNLRIVTPESVKFQDHIRHIFLISGKEGLRLGKARGLLPVSLGIFPTELLKRLTAFFIPGACISGIFPEDFQKRFKLFDGTGKERKKIGETRCFRGDLRHA